MKKILLKTSNIAPKVEEKATALETSVQPQPVYPDNQNVLTGYRQ